jgi:RNA polymerase sigma-70 factor (ECF subfamily)
MKYATLSANELARVCSQSDDAEAWEEFVRRFTPKITIVIWRVARRYRQGDPALIEDLVHNTFFKCLADGRRLLRKFVPRHEDAIYGMLAVTAKNLTYDYFRKHKPPKPGNEDVQLSEIEPFVPSTSFGPKQIEREVTMHEIEEALQAITASSSFGERDREIFWLHHLYGLTANEIAALAAFHLSAKGVESILHRLMVQLRTWFAEDEEDEEAPQEGAEGISSRKTLFKGEEEP